MKILNENEVNMIYYTLKIIINIIYSELITLFISFSLKYFFNMKLSLTTKIKKKKLNVKLITHGGGKIDNYKHENNAFISCLYICKSNIPLFLKFFI